MFVSKSFNDSDTTFKHIGNLLVNATERELYAIFEQYMRKTKMDKESMIKYFSEIVNCESFDFYGEMCDTEDYLNNE